MISRADHRLPPMLDWTLRCPAVPVSSALAIPGAMDRISRLSFSEGRGLAWPTLVYVRPVFNQFVQKFPGHLILGEVALPEEVLCGSPMPARHASKMGGDALAAPACIHSVVDRLHLVRDFLEGGLDPAAPLGEGLREGWLAWSCIGLWRRESVRRYPGTQKPINASPLNPLSARRPRGVTRPPACRRPLRALACRGGHVLQARIILLAAVWGRLSPPRPVTDRTQTPRHGVVNSSASLHAGAGSGGVGRDWPSLDCVIDEHDTAEGKAAGLNEIERIFCSRLSRPCAARTGATGSPMISS